tara:strand:- start:368 stop:1300 length:933 start_codon:yes stop_codon:yes gene_type:complete
MHPVTQNILITGAEGFLGSNLIDFLMHNTNHKIFSISKNKIYADYPPERFVSIKHNLLNSFSDDLKIELKEINYIIHLAGSSDVERSRQYPVESIKNNVIVTTNLLEFARVNTSKLKQFLFFSTAEVFGPSKNNKRFKESDAYTPHSPYAVTKAAAQEMCLSYFRTYDLPVAITHVMNTYGKSQAENKFIPKMTKMISNGEKVFLHANNGPSQRNYLHVQDICDAILFLMNKATVGERYNIVSDTDTNNLEIAKMIAKILNRKLEYELIAPTRERKHYALSLLDGSKLRDLGWRPKVPMEVGLREFINNE